MRCASESNQDHLDGTSNYWILLSVLCLMKLTWMDIVRAHRYVRKDGVLFRKEQEIFQREADYLNKLLKRKKARPRSTIKNEPKVL